MRTDSVAAAWICLGLLLPGALHAQAGFITVGQGPGELEADRILADKLGPSLIADPKDLAYETVIGDLIADRLPNGTVARVTPYAFVVAEMLGAKLDVIATFRSKTTGSTTYGAWLVVRRSDFPPDTPASGPTLAQVLEFVQSRSGDGKPARFVYHDKFSTSSYFLPSLYFRAQKVFAAGDEKAGGDEKADGISTINVERLSNGTSELVRAVADHKADVASVWDGTRARFIQAADPKLSQTGRRVWFVRFPANLPSDLLVATRNVAEAVKKGVRSKLEREPIVRKGPASIESDVESWVLWSERDAEAARRALSELRRQAAAWTLPVVVDVRQSETVSAGEVEAVRQAIRLAGTELVESGEYADYYKQSDIVWELARIHDGALRLTVRYDHFFDSKGSEIVQRFEISFLTPTDLTRRVSALINSRMHRIRPVWLYWDSAPTVIRDVAFDTSEGELLPFQRILWKDPQRNDYRLEHNIDKVTRLEKSDFNKLELDRAPFPQEPDKRLAFEPMGRQAFRVLLLRPSRESRMFRALTVALVALLGLAALGLAWDVWRWQTQRVARPPMAAAPAALTAQA